MKTLPLHGKYDKLSPLTKEDEVTFRRLLMGGHNSKQLYATPVNPNSYLICEEFSIEHHQLVYSVDEGKLYLVFRPIRRYFWEPKYAYYGIELYRQPDYIALFKSYSSSHLLPEGELDRPHKKLRLV